MVRKIHFPSNKVLLVVVLPLLTAACSLPFGESSPRLRASLPVTAEWIISE